MSKLILIVGICQLIAGVIVVGLVAKDFHDVNSSKTAVDTMKVRAFGPLLIGLIVMVSGIFGILSDRSSSAKLDVFYLISATVAASAAAAMVWNYGLDYHDRCNREVLGVKVKFNCNEEQERILITLLVLSVVACATSILGMVSAGLTTCRKV